MLLVSLLPTSVIGVKGKLILVAFRAYFLDKTFRVVLEALGISRSCVLFLCWEAYLTDHFPQRRTRREQKCSILSTTLRLTLLVKLFDSTPTAIHTSETYLTYLNFQGSLSIPLCNCLPNCCLPHLPSIDCWQVFLSFPLFRVPCGSISRPAWWCRYLVCIEWPSQPQCLLLICNSIFSCPVVYQKSSFETVSVSMYTLNAKGSAKDLIRLLWEWSTSSSGPFPWLGKIFYPVPKAGKRPWEQGCRMVSLLRVCTLYESTANGFFLLVQLYLQENSL